MTDDATPTETAPASPSAKPAKPPAPGATKGTAAEPHGTAALPDAPFTGDRGWKGLATDPGEKAAFGLALGIIGLLVVTTLVWGLPGLFTSGLLLTVVIVAALLVISMGN